MKTPVSLALSYALLCATDAGKRASSSLLITRTATTFSTGSDGG